jgi:hypothetical protein
MKGSPTHPAAKHERGTTASEMCVFRDDEGAGILGRTAASRPPNEDRIRGLSA